MSKQAHPDDVSPLHGEVADRFGVLPNFFRLAPEAPAITENLWGFAKFGYLDNPLPPLFKERLFVYLSRFCEVRYCIARHVGFLAGLGRPSGDRLCSPETVEQVVRLIRRELPRGDDLGPYLTRLEAFSAPLLDLPGAGTPIEETIFACATHVFLQTPQAARCLAALRRVFDAPMFQHLLVFLSFVRTAHFWTKLHPELQMEEDITNLLAVHEALAECVVNDPEAAACETTQSLMNELAELRRDRALRQEVEQANVALREREVELQEAQRVAHVGSWRWDVRTDVTTGSEELFRIYGLDPNRQPFPGFSDQDGTLYPHEDWERINLAIQETTQTGVGYELDVRAFRNGEPIWITTRSEAVKNTSGEVVALRGTVQDITDRKRAEAELRQSEHRERLRADELETVMAAVPAVVWIAHDRECRRITGNRAASELLRLPHEANQSVTAPDGEKPLHFKVLKEGVELRPDQLPVQMAATGLEIRDFEEEVVFEDGTGTHLFGHAIPLRDEHGQVRGSVAAFVDISDRKRADEALRRSEERLRRMINVDGVGVLVWALPEGRLIGANDHFLRMFGYARAEVESGTLTWRDMTPSEYIAVSEKQLEGFAETGRIGPYEKEYFRKDGSRAWMVFAGATLGDGTVVEYCIDVGDRKRAEEALRRSEERLRNIFDQATAGIAQVDLNGQFITVNQRFCEITGYTEEELKNGLTRGGITHPDDQNRDRAMFELSLTNRKPYVIEKRYLRKDGTSVWVRNSVSPFMDAAGRPEHMLAVAIDINDRKLAENLQAGQRGVLEMIAKGAPLPDVLRRVCQLIEEQEPGLLCSILLTDEVGKHTGLGIGPSLPDEFVLALQGIDISPPHVGSCCKALDCGQEVLVADIENDERWSPLWRDLNLSHGLRACRSIPICGSGGSVLASVAVFRRQPGDPGPANKELLDIATHLAGIAIDRWRDVERERELLVREAMANAKFRALFDQGPLFAGIMQLDGTVIEPNRLSLDACGYTREQVVGKPFWDCPWWSPSPALVQQIRDATTQAAAGETFRAEIPYYIADGSERIVDFVLMPIMDEAGRVLFLAPTGTDITDRKRAEDALRRSELRYRLVGQAANDAIWDWDLATNEATWHEGVQRLFGYTPEQIGPDAKWWYETIHPDDRERVVHDIHAAIDGGEELWRGEYRFRRADGSYAEVLDRGRIVREGTKPIRMVGSMFDLTERKQAEGALREADRRKDEFLATLAHELRNPLAPLRNGLQVLRLAGSNGEMADEARTMMERQLGQMVHLIDDLLDLSRISRGKIELRKERVELAKIVQQAVETSRPAIENAGHDFLIDVPPGTIYVDADVTRLAQVFSNLLNNAAKYTERGGRDPTDGKASRDGGGRIGKG